MITAAEAKELLGNGMTDEQLENRIKDAAKKRNYIFEYLTDEQRETLIANGFSVIKFDDKYNIEW